MRTATNILDHVDPVVNHLQTAMDGYSASVTVSYGERPIDASKKFIPPPYVVVFHIVGGRLDGPLSDTQADIELRILVVCYGNTARETTILRDLTHAEMMDKSNFTVTGRRIRDIRLETPSDGIYRDDDVSTPIFYTRTIYVMNTVPA